MNGNLFVFRPRGNPGRERLQRLAVAHERHVRRGGRKMVEFDDSLSLCAPARFRQEIGPSAWSAARSRS
jgi:hypothetical protein